MGNCGHFVLAGIATPMFDYYSRKPNTREALAVREYNYHRRVAGTLEVPFDAGLNLWVPHRSRFFERWEALVCSPLVD